MDRHPIVQASLAYGFVPIAGRIYDMNELSWRGRLRRIKQNAFGATERWKQAEITWCVSSANGDIGG